MASLFRIDGRGVSASPDTRLIKAEEWAAFLGAAQITAEAQRCAVDQRRVTQEAFAAEKERGYEEGIQKSRREQAESMMETVLKSIEYLEGMEKSIAGLVGDALRKILDDIPPEERIVSVVRQALNLVRGQKKVTLVVAAEDADTLRSRMDEILARYASIDFIDIKADARLPSGSCLLQSAMGTIDAGMETQIQAVVNVLEKRQKG
jgi:type III secretion protein L